MKTDWKDIETHRPNEVQEYWTLDSSNRINRGRFWACVQRWFTLDYEPIENVIMFAEIIQPELPDDNR